MSADVAGHVDQLTMKERLAVLIAAQLLVGCHRTMPEDQRREYGNTLFGLLERTFRDEPAPNPS